MCAGSRWGDDDDDAEWSTATARLMAVILSVKNVAKSVTSYKIIETPANLVYLPITLDAIYSIETSLTDQNDQRLNLRGENVTIRFHVREI